MHTHTHTHTHTPSTHTTHTHTHTHTHNSQWLDCGVPFVLSTVRLLPQAWFLPPVDWWNKGHHFVLLFKYSLEEDLASPHTHTHTHTHTLHTHTPDIWHTQIHASCTCMHTVYTHAYTQTYSSHIHNNPLAFPIACWWPLTTKILLVDKNNFRFLLLKQSDGVSEKKRRNPKYHNVQFESSPPKATCNWFIL